MKYYLTGTTNTTYVKALEYANKRRPAVVRRLLAPDSIWADHSAIYLSTKPVQPGQAEFQIMPTDEFFE